MQFRYVIWLLYMNMMQIVKRHEIRLMTNNVKLEHGVQLQLTAPKLFASFGRFGLRDMQLRETYLHVEC